MQHFKARMTKLKNLINRFPESGDIFGYQGVTKNVLLTALDTAYDLAQGINDDDAQNQLIIISLKRMSSAFYTKYKNVLDSDSGLPERGNFDVFIDDLAGLIEKTKSVYFICNSGSEQAARELTTLKGDVEAFKKFKASYDQEFESAKKEVAEMKELKANPESKAKGVVIEAKLDNSKGPIATILVQNGTLKVADSIVVGTVTGKVRAMMDDKGRRVNSAGPSTPVSIMGLDDVPNAGDILYAVDENLVKQVAEERKKKERENMISSSQTVTLDDVFNKISEGEMKGLNIIVKADVQGSVEAVKQSMEKLSNEEVKVKVIHAQAGAINESDIMLAESSKAIIIGFNVRPDSNAKQIAERSGVDIKLYRVIYEAIEDVEKALKGMLAPKLTETYMGKAEVREVFKISGVGQIAGSYVTEGKIVRNGKLRIYRDNILYAEGNVLQLKRFKDDVKEVRAGYECGFVFEKFNDLKEFDQVEAFKMVEVDRETALKFLAKQLNALEDAPLGILLICYRGKGLGFLKNIGRRVNNLLPNSRRILNL